MSEGVGLSKELVDFSARIGVAARLEGVDRTQLEKLIASLDFIGDERLCIYVTQAYAARQLSRRELGNITTRLTIDALSRCTNRNQARAVLGLAKWVYEGAKTIRFRNIRRDNVEKITFEDYIKEVRR